MNLEKEIFDIALTDIMPNRFQPREIFEDEALRELSASIREHGVIQPIIVRKVGDKFEIIAGARRFRASQLAGKETIPALVRDIDDKEAAKIALLENLQRKDLTPIEEAKTYQTILKLDNITQEELAQNLGKSQSAVANKLRLLNLDEEVQTALLNSQISERHARSLLPIPHEKQRELLHKIIENRLTVRQVDEEIMRLTGKMPEQDELELSQPTIPSSMNQNLNNNQNVISQNIVGPASNVQTTSIMPEPNMISNQNIIKPEPEVSPIVSNTEQMPETPMVQTQETKEQNNVNVPIIETPQEENMEPINEAAIIPEISSEIETPAVESKQEEKPASFNIFDSLRVKPEEQPTTINSEKEVMQTPYENIYDLRFAINNFRQAIQNTEKFGFKVKAEEIDNPDKYQIVITIDKNS